LFRQRKEAEPAPEPVAEDGQATLEFVGTIWLVITLMVVMWQVALWGVSAAYTSHAADEAAREAGIGSSIEKITYEAENSVPRFFRSDMHVTRTASGTVKVRSELPILLPAVSVDGLSFTSEVEVVEED
jgi:pilus assembly protein CpaE